MSLEGKGNLLPPLGQVFLHTSDGVMTVRGGSLIRQSRHLPKASPSQGPRRRLLCLKNRLWLSSYYINPRYSQRSFVPPRSEYSQSASSLLCNTPFHQGTAQSPRHLRKLHWNSRCPSRQNTSRHTHTPTVNCPAPPRPPANPVRPFSRYLVQEHS